MRTMVDYAVPIDDVRGSIAQGIGEIIDERFTFETSTETEFAFTVVSAALAHAPRSNRGEGDYLVIPTMRQGDVDVIDGASANELLGFLGERHFGKGPGIGNRDSHDTREYRLSSAHTSEFQRMLEWAHDISEAGDAMRNRQPLRVAAHAGAQLLMDRHTSLIYDALDAAQAMLLHETKGTIAKLAGSPKLPKTIYSREVFESNDNNQLVARIEVGEGRDRE